MPFRCGLVHMAAMRAFLGKGWLWRVRLLAGVLGLFALCSCASPSSPAAPTRAGTLPSVPRCPASMRAIKQKPPCHECSKQQEVLRRAGNAWLASLLRWMKAHARYPEQALRKHEQGNATVHFVVAPDGRISQTCLLKGSGSFALDENLYRLVEGAKVPPPAQFGGETMWLTLHYTLVAPAAVGPQGRTGN